MLEAELVSVAIDEISRVVSHRKPFTERGLPTWLRAPAELTSVPWVEHRMRKPVGTCLQVGISRTRNLPSAALSSRVPDRNLRAEFKP
jgi:hypothetical protein